MTYEHALVYTLVAGFAIAVFVGYVSRSWVRAFAIFAGVCLGVLQLWH